MRKMRRKNFSIKAFLIVVYTMLFLATNSIKSVSVTLVNSSNPFQSDEWPMFHHDPRRSGYSTLSAPNKNSTLWIFESSDIPPIASPVVAYGMVYLKGYSKIYAFNASTGEVVWIYSPVYIYYEYPAVAHGMVYVPTNDGILALNAYTGVKNWNYTTNGSTISPLILDDYVFTGSSEGKIYCLNASTGVEIWSYSTRWRDSYAMITALAVANDKIYATTSGYYAGGVWMLDAVNGSLIRYVYSGNYLNAHSIIIGYGMVYVGADIRFYALDAETLSVKWDYSAPESFATAAFFVSDTRVYITSSYESKLYCLDIDGNFLWEFPLIKEENRHLMSSPAIADGKIFIGDHSGKFYAINATIGSIMWSYNTGTIIMSSPAIAYDTVFVCSDGKLYAFYDSETYPRQFIHDIAIIDKNLHKKKVLCQGWTMRIYVSIDNQGDFNEELVNVTLYINGSLIEIRSVNLPFLERINLTFVWNATELEKGIYEISLSATPVSSENDTSDNSFIYGMVAVSIEGDITGELLNVPDGKVDIRDIALVAIHYGKTSSYLSWNPNCDINDDNKVDILDIAIVARNFGKIDP
jgi:outer membrane protein assembly factor BamB